MNPSDVSKVSSLWSIRDNVSRNECYMICTECTSKSIHRLFPSKALFSFTRMINTMHRSRRRTLSYRFLIAFRSFHFDIEPSNTSDFEGNISSPVQPVNVTVPSQWQTFTRAYRYRFNHTSLFHQKNYFSRMVVH